MFSNIYLLPYEDDFVSSVITMHINTFDPSVQLAPILCNGRTWVKRPLSEFAAAYAYNIGTSFGNRHFGLCIWDTIPCQNVETTGIIAIIMLKIKKFLPAVTEIWVRMARQMARMLWNSLTISIKKHHDLKDICTNSKGKSDYLWPAWLLILHDILI